MNHYVSIYKRDYTSPLVSAARRPKSPTAIFKSCTCTDSRQALKKLVDVKVEECFDSSRMKPTGWLSEPKIYPKTQPRIQEVDKTPFDQPRGCVKTLEIQCPEFYKMLEKAQLEERASRVEADRMKTTYQIDFSDPAARMTQLSRIRDMDDQQLQCRVPIKITIEADCPPQCRPPSLKYNGSTRARKYDFKQKNALKRGKPCEDIEGRLAQLPSWKTEYQDSINKIGQTIMKVKLHQMKKKVLPVLTVSN
ncbi:uncharacterized protein [Linepithema humile]|uniref:uncharacterized protein isoform X2 n=1 Tax=Linepithema humile TaxID=83485 RepID=UPI00351DBF60